MPWIWQPEHVRCRNPACNQEFDTEPSPAGGGHKRRIYCTRACYRTDRGRMARERREARERQAVTP